MYSLNRSPLDRKKRKEENKVRARKMVLVMGLVCLLMILAMMAKVYL